jgi:hypothetical protein
LRADAFNLDADEHAPIPLHGGAVVIPIRMLAGDELVVAHEPLQRVRQ